MKTTRFFSTMFNKSCNKYFNVHYSLLHIIYVYFLYRYLFFDELMEFSISAFLFLKYISYMDICNHQFLSLYLCKICLGAIYLAVEIQTLHLNFFLSIYFARQAMYSVHFILSKNLNIVIVDMFRLFAVKSSGFV